MCGWSKYDGCMCGRCRRRYRCDYRGAIGSIFYKYHHLSEYFYATRIVEFVSNCCWKLVWLPVTVYVDETFCHCRVACIQLIFLIGKYGQIQTPLSRRRVVWRRGVLPLQRMVLNAARATSCVRQCGVGIQTRIYAAGMEAGV